MKSLLEKDVFLRRGRNNRDYLKMFKKFNLQDEADEMSNLWNKKWMKKAARK